MIIIIKLLETPLNPIFGLEMYISKIEGSSTPTYKMVYFENLEIKDTHFLKFVD